MGCFAPKLVVQEHVNKVEWHKEYFATIISKKTISQKVKEINIEFSLHNQSVKPRGAIKQEMLLFVTLLYKRGRFFLKI